MFKVRKERVGVLDSWDGNRHQWKKRVAYGISWVFVACMDMMCLVWM